jgi:hypothetical protein
LVGVQTARSYGPAPYFTIHALGEPGKLGAQWLAIKSAALGTSKC